MARFKLYSDGKFRLSTDKGLFTADSKKHSIEEVNEAFENDGFTEMDFTTKDGGKVYCIANATEEVGNDYSIGTAVNVAPVSAQEVLEIELDYITV